MALHPTAQLWPNSLTHLCVAIDHCGHKSCWKYCILFRRQCCCLPVQVTPKWLPLTEGDWNYRSFSTKELISIDSKLMYACFNMREVMDSTSCSLEPCVTTVCQFNEGHTFWCYLALPGSLLLFLWCCYKPISQWQRSLLSNESCASIGLQIFFSVFILWHMVPGCSGSYIPWHLVHVFWHISVCHIVCVQSGRVN